MVHGGAGALDNVKDDKTAHRYLESIRRTLEHGRDVMELGGSALQAVEACASLLEDDPVFNAGCGSVLNENGKVEMDAAIMDGRDLSAGAVAAVDNIANPVQLARLVMSNSEHVMLISEGAMRFADHCGMERVPEDYFYTTERVEQLRQARLKHKIMLDHDDPRKTRKTRNTAPLVPLLAILKVTWLLQHQPGGSSTSAWAASVTHRLSGQAFMPTTRPVPFPLPVSERISCALLLQKPFLTSCI
jgi:isoaspartyl peptidase/L-asparaginase-like protein (Ntn-hydrolase superfamily)